MSEVTPTPESDSRKPVSYRLKRLIAKATLVACAANIVPVSTTMYAHHVGPVKAMEHVTDTYQALYYDVTGRDACIVPGSPLSDMEQAVVSEGSEQWGETAAKLQAATEKGAKFVSPDDLRATKEKLRATTDMQEKVAIVSDFTKPNFGFDTVVADEEFARMDATTLDEGLAAFVEYSSLLPANLLQKTGIDTLYIGAEPIVKHDGVTLGWYNNVTDDTWVSAAALKTPATFIHEVIGHGAHDTACRGVMSKDTSFPKLNPSGYEYTGSAVVSFATENDPANNANSYGQTNKKEDVATTIEVYLTSDMDFDSASLESPIGQKTVLILRRIEEIQPGSAEALLAVKSELTYMQQYPGSTTVAPMLPTAN